MPSESSLVNACLIYLRTQGCMVWRANTGAMRIQARGRRERFVRFGPVGQPDIIGLTKEGRFVAVECKRKPNRLTWAQSQFLADAWNRGAIAICAYSIEDLRFAFEEDARSKRHAPEASVA